MDSPAGKLNPRQQRESGRGRNLIIALLILLYLLHNDYWNWGAVRFWLGVPVGLLYHLGLCLLASILFGLLVRTAWPRHLESPSRDETT